VDTVGNITSNQRAPYVERFSLAMILPRYLLIAHGAFIGGFGMVILGMLGVMHNVSSPLNPFAAYADIMPGQPSGAIDAHGFSCPMREYNGSEIYCRKSWETGVFSSVEVVHSDGQIRRTDFALREGTLNIGNIALLLGLSEIHPHTNVLFLWRGKLGFALVVNQSERFSVFSRVRHITLTNTRLSKP
jgi:hypothetical protein